MQSLPGAIAMQRLVEPSDYVLQDVLGQSTYVIPWEPRLCPGNPAGDPEVGAKLYNEFVLDEVNGEHPPTPEQRFAAVIEWTLSTPGEAARSLAADLAAAYQGKYYFLLNNLEHLDAETQGYRIDLVFHNDDIQGLSAKVVMALRARAVR
jgi:hypothetical protein